MSTETIFQVSLAEQEMLGDPCHAVCFGILEEFQEYGVCGVLLRGESSSPDDILCADCLEAGLENLCRHCKTSTCDGLDAARVR